MKKFAIVFGERKTDLQKQAVEELSAVIAEYTREYPLSFAYENGKDLSDYKCIYIGTKASNPYIRVHSKDILSKAEEYVIRVENNVAVIEGYDDAGALYGALDFYNKYIVKHEHRDKPPYWRNFLEEDTLPDFLHTSAPSVKERGLWTWGHVIYDYREYLHNMMKLKMNRVVIWNDFVPTNANEIVAFAHARNIKVIWGFAWLWDTNCGRIDIRNLEACPREIFEKYETEYAGIDGDGIYFQTFTEWKDDAIEGVNIASAATDLVNRTAALFYEKYPEMEIQFGLHATSVKNHLDVIGTVDPRIRIVWEDCGAFPFAYSPNDVADFDGTKEFVRRISRLRSTDDRFGVVTKGLVNLDWLKFEHLTGPQTIGVSTRSLKASCLEEKQKIWRYIQAGWLVNADKAHEMTREMQCLKNGDLSILALVEDGLFEEKIMYPVALFSEVLWDCNSTLNTIMNEVALRSYVSFA